MKQAAISTTQAGLHKPNNNIPQSTFSRLRIDDVDVFLEDFGSGRGKITLSGYGHNYSYTWGAMGGSLQEFIMGMGPNYFADKLCSNTYKDSMPGTFKALRKHIREDILPWYKHMEFQKEMRREISEWQAHCGSGDEFVREFTSFIGRLPYHLIKDRLERQDIESEFQGISEPWHLIEQEISDEYVWLMKFHDKLKKELTK